MAVCVPCALQLPLDPLSSVAPLRCTWLRRGSAQKLQAPVAETEAPGVGTAGPAASKPGILFSVFVSCGPLFCCPGRGYF